jgi:hypothetical protein
LVLRLPLKRLSSQTTYLPVRKNIREELVQYTSEQNPTAKQTIKEKMLTWKDEEQIQVNDRLYITAHHWNSTTWSINSKQETLPKELRNVEPLLEAIVVKICPKTIDLEIPLLASI